MIKAYTDFDGYVLIKKAIEKRVDDFVWVSIKPLINRDDYDEIIYLHPSYGNDTYGYSDVFIDNPDERIRVSTKHIRLNIGNHTIHINK